MTKIHEYLSSLPEETKTLFEPVFGDIDRFYTVVYLISRNEHITDQEKPDRYEDRLQVIRSIKHKVENMLDSFQLDGKEIIADITSDYLDDYIAYKEKEPDISNDEFIRIIQKITQL